MATLALTLGWLSDLPLLLLLLALLLLLSLFLFYNILEESVTGVPCNRHIAVLFEFRVVALSFLRDAISKEAT